VTGAGVEAAGAGHPSSLSLAASSIHWSTSSRGSGSTAAASNAATVYGRMVSHCLERSAADEDPVGGGQAGPAGSAVRAYQMPVTG